MEIDLDTFLKLASLFLSISAMVYAFFVNRKKDTDERFNEGSKRMDRHHSRIAAVEQSIKAMPGKDDIHALQLEAVKQTGALREMQAVMDGNAKIMSRLETIVSRHEDHLLDGGKK
ncbi:DUF2730 domain-containing protein [Aliiroseovarius crassostreae]|uniref:DUF2730 domain-containing protein n=1 Tax=Aliiroseovarius crassostreae TaxID=154981 RepID=UPI0021FFED89|nr:DUF2730 domain-containing protein [Aliiroseovarius crassostreae]UWQ00837.1 DUF2730 domain-containing protein [Aliiroseovarius crassostreae]